jgi:ketosteroid isomerase-like protein
VSQENVEIARAAYDAWNKGDLQFVLDHLAPDVQWEENPDVYPGLDPVYCGHDGFLKRQRDAFDIWAWFKVEARDFIDAGEHIVVPLRLMAKGRHSGIEVEMYVYDCLTFRERKVVWHRIYADRTGALKAVGLEG